MRRLAYESGRKSGLALLLIWLLVVLTSSLPAQTAAQEDEFARLFKLGVQQSELQPALQHFDAAAASIPSLPAERQGLARFWLEVSRAEAYFRQGSSESLQACRQLAEKARAQARKDGCYRSYYRTTLLILLWQCMDTLDFDTLLAEQGGDDRQYLLHADTNAELAKRGATELQWPLRILRCDLRMAAEEAQVIEELRSIGQSLQRLQDPELMPWRDLAYHRLAWHFLVRREYERALLLLDELPAKLTRYPRALIALQRQDYTGAEQQARALLQGEQHAAALVLLGDALEGQGRYAEALQSYRQLLQLETLPINRAVTFNAMGDCYLALQRLDQAGQAYAKSMQQLEKLRDLALRQLHSEFAENHKDLGRLAEARKDAAAAFVHYQQSLVELDLGRRSIPLDVLGIAWLEPAQLAAVEGLLRSCKAAGEDPLTALVWLDSMKARGLLDWLQHPPTQAALTDYRKALHQLALAEGVESTRAGRKVLESWRSAQSQQRQGQVLQAEELQTLLQSWSKTLVLSYWVGEQEIYLLAVGQQSQLLLSLGKRDDGLQCLRQAYQAVTQAGDVTQPNADAWPDLDAAAAFFLPTQKHPALAQLYAEAERVVFCPDDILRRLPMACLRPAGAGETLQPLGLSKMLLYAPSLSVLAALSQRQARGSQVVIMDSAQPDPAQEALFAVSPLRHSEHEGDLVARAYGGALRLRRQHASYSELAALLHKSSKSSNPVGLLHINCHAVQHLQVPTRSLLLLSDGPADVVSLANLPMQGAFVVLTACASATGNQGGGEGVNGLLWGGFAAGARGMVASHWPVNQQASADLMGQFHHHRAQGHSAEFAMRAARRVLAQADQYAHPHYWAGFDVFAAPGVEPAPSWWGMGWWTALLLLLLLAALIRRRLRA